MSRAFEARDDVKVEVEHGLARERTVQLHDHHAGGLEDQAHGFGDALGKGDDLGKVVRWQLEDLGRRSARDDQRMARRLRHQIHERHAVVVLVDDVGASVAAQDLRERVVRIVVRGFGTHGCMLAGRTGRFTRLRTPG